MRYVAAYLLAVLGGNSNPSKEDIEKILESVGLDVDAERLSKVGDMLGTSRCWDVPMLGCPDVGGEFGRERKGRRKGGRG